LAAEDFNDVLASPAFPLVIAVLVWGFAFAAKLSLLARDPADPMLFAIAGVAVIEFV
jgi:hypothetical protein